MGTIFAVCKLTGLKPAGFCHKTSAGGVYLLQKWESGVRF
jgi:hypothetical protein